MTVALLLLAAVAVMVVATAMRNAGTARRGPARPGEGMTRPDVPVTDDMVTLRVLVPEEAHVVRGLLEGAGMPVAMVPADPDDLVAARYRTMPRQYRLLVPEDRAAEAEALLAGPLEL
jgi:hypothetical protein